MTLKQKYLEWFSTIIGLDSSCYNVTFEQVIDQLAIESGKSFKDIVPHINTIKDLKKGLLLLDKSGIGLYTLAYLLAKNWAQDQVFSTYKYVIVVPIEQMHKLNSNKPTGLQSLFDIWGEPAPITINPSEVLVIVSGYTKRTHDFNKQASTLESVIQNEWFKLCKTVDHIVITDSAMKEYPLNKTIQVSLKPIGLKVKHRTGEYYIDGKVILEEAIATVEQVFFHQKNANTIQTTLDFHKQVKSFLNGGDYKKSTITVDKVYPFITPQTLIKQLITGVEGPEQDISKLQTPAEWFCAAVTMALNPNGKDYASYNVGGHLIGRKQNNYVADLGSISTVTEKTLNKVQNSDSTEQMLKMLQELVKHPSFEKFSPENIIGELRKIKYKLEENGVIKRPQNYKEFLETLNVISNPSVNILGMFYGNQRDASYLKFQTEINKVIQGNSNISFTELVRAVMMGQTQNQIPQLEISIAAIMLAETARRPSSFLVTLCLLDLITINPQSNAIGACFFAHPIPTASNPLEAGILLDITQILGGYHPMASGNSYLQAQDVDNKFGLNWVEFKELAIYIDWLSHSLEREKDLNPYLQGEIVLKADPNMISISNLLLDFAHKKLGHVKPLIFDRFSRCLDTFDFSLHEKSPDSELIPYDSQAFKKYIEENKCTTLIRSGLPREIVQRNANLNEFITIFLPPMGHIKSAFVLEGKGEFKTALHHYRRVLQIDPKFHLVHYFMAQVYLFHVIDLEKFNLHIDEFFNKVEPEAGDLYFCAMYLKIRFYKMIGDMDELLESVNFYFDHYHDETDFDYWDVIAMRAEALYITCDFISAKNDFELFLSNKKFKNKARYKEVKSLYDQLLEKNIFHYAQDKTEIKHSVSNVMPYTWFNRVKDNKLAFGSAAVVASLAIYMAINNKNTM